MKDFSPLFEASQGEPIVAEGTVLHRRYWLEVGEGDRLLLRFVSSTSEYIQGLRLMAERCQLSVENFKGKELVLWTDTAPEQVTVRVLKVTKGARVGLLNVWKDRQHQTMMYALTSSAMKVVHTTASEFKLLCSDGSGSPDFTDLVVEVQHSMSSAKA